MQVTMAKVVDGRCQVLVTCTDGPVASQRSVLLQLVVGNFLISMAEAVCLQKALDIVLGGD